jgi:hypothetical protein
MHVNVAVLDRDWAFAEDLPNALPPALQELKSLLTARISNLSPVPDRLIRIRLCPPGGGLSP